MKKILGEKLVTMIFNWASGLLRNKKPLEMNREEARYFGIHFGQFGEDLAVNRWVEKLNIEKGFYVDIGAFHPIHLSNTLLLFKKGWRGVNIDLNPEKIRLFEKYRREDCNICCAVSSKSDKFVVENRGRTTEKLRPYNPQFDGNICRSSIVVSKPFSELAEDLEFPNGRVDYLNIDCEGHDFEVMKCVDLEKYGVSIITIEALDKSSEDSIKEYLNSHGYVFQTKIHWTLLFTKQFQ